LEGVFGGFWVGLAVSLAAGSGDLAAGVLLRRFRLARNAAASFSGEDLAIKNPSKTAWKSRKWKSEKCGFPSWNPYVIAAHP
jgi:hypothetical protein